MVFTPVTDAGIPIFAALGIFLPFFLFPGVVLIQVVALWRILPKAKAFRDSFLMNLVSALTGWYPSWYIRTSGVIYVDSALDWAIFLTSLMLIACALSVVIEGIVLLILERQYPVRQIWLASLATNIASYIVLCSVLIIGMIVGTKM